MDTTFVGQIPLRGDLRITVRRADTGAIHRHYEIRNTIVYAALKGLVNLLAQKTTLTDPLDYQIAYLRVGTGTTAPTRSDTNLEIPATPQPPDAPSAIPHTMVLDDAGKVLTVIGPYEIKILATLEASKLNGLSLTEAGLFTRGNSALAQPPGLYAGHYPELFARQIHAAIPKSAGFVVDYDWRIAFTA